MNNVCVSMHAKYLLFSSWPGQMFDGDLFPTVSQVVLEALRRRSSKVRTEAFHILKIFIANPKKPYAVERFLHLNAQKILKTLTSGFEHFQKDETLMEEFENARTKIEELKDSPAPAAPTWFTITQADVPGHLGVYSLADFQQIQISKARTNLSLYIVTAAEY